MSRKARPAVVGGFVVGAVVLGIIAVMALGSGQLFRETYTYVTYFDSDVNGLNVGAPVKFKGVEIGAVKDILLNMEGMRQFTQPSDRVVIPVIIELDAAKTSRRGAANAPTPAVISYLISRGLRAQLATESFVTGVLYVKLDLMPGSPLKLRGDDTVAYPEIPTLPTEFELVQSKVAEFFAKLQEIDVSGLVDDMKDSIQNVNKLASSPGLAKAVDHLDVTLAQIDETLASVRRTSEAARNSVEPATEEVRAVAADLRETLDEAARTMASMRDLLDPQAPLAVGMTKTLADVSDASRAVQRLADLLERSPDALLRGRGAPEHKP